MTRLTAFFHKIQNHTVVKNSTLVLAGSMIANVLAYGYHIAVGRILGPEGYGELAALLSLFAILNVPSQVVQTILTKFFSVLRAQKKTGEVKTLFNVSVRILLGIVVLGLGGVLVGIGTVSSFLHIPSRADFYWLYATFALYSVAMVPQSILQAYQLFLAQFVLTTVGMSLRLVLAVLAAPFGVTATLASNILANIATMIGYVIPLGFLFRQKATTLSLPSKRTIGYSIPALFVTLASAALYNQDVILIKHFFSPSEAGIYSSLSVLGKVIFYASSSLTYVLFPVIAERKELRQNHTKLASVALGSVGALSGGLTVLYFLFPTTVVHILYGPTYNAAIPYVGLFGIFISFFSLDSMLLSICMAAEKTRAWIFAIGAAGMQLSIIWFVHASLHSVVLVNIGVASALFVVLLLYYVHEQEDES